MKAFQLNPVLKKWALTGCLTAALGFSVSHNKHLEGFAAVDMASTDMVEGKLATDKGLVPVKYLANGSEKITAMVSSLDAEGKVCITCENKVVTISASFEKNKDDIQALNVLLLKELKNKETPAKEIAKKTYVADPDLDIPAEENFTQGKLDKIIEKCERKDDKAEVMDCKANALVSLMKTYKDSKDSKKKLDESKLRAFSKTHIESAIAGQIRESRRLATLLRKGVDLSPEDMGKDPEEVRAKSLEVIQTMLEGIPGKYESVRRSLVSAEVSLSSSEAIEAQKALRDARDSKNLGQMQNANLQIQGVQGLIANLAATNQSGLTNALSLNDVNSSLLDKYSNSLNNYLTQLRMGIAQNPYDFKIPQMDLSGLGVVDGTAISSISGSIDPNKTNIIVITGERSGRPGSPFANTTSNAGSIAPTANNTVVFGPVQAMTAEQIKARNSFRTAK